jgi:hypothetical protein
VADVRRTVADEGCRGLTSTSSSGRPPRALRRSPSERGWLGANRMRRSECLFDPADRRFCPCRDEQSSHERSSADPGVPQADGAPRPQPARRMERPHLPREQPPMLVAIRNCPAAVTTVMRLRNCDLPCAEGDSNARASAARLGQALFRHGSASIGSCRARARSSAAAAPRRAATAPSLSVICGPRRQPPPRPAAPRSRGHNHRRNPHAVQRPPAHARERATPSWCLLSVSGQSPWP